MKVNNLSSTQPMLAAETPIELKEGETYSGVVKERLSSDEAIVQIRGKEVHVKFEGGVPKDDRVQIQVTKFSGELPIVKAGEDVTTNKQLPLDNDLGKLFKSLGINPTTELSSAVKMVHSFGVQIDKKMVEILRNYLSNMSGTDIQKLDALKALLTKKLDFSLPNLTAVYSALHDRNFTNQLENHINNTFSQQKSIQLVLDKVLQSNNVSEDMVRNPENQSKLDTNLLRADHQGHSGFEGRFPKKLIDEIGSAQNSNILNTSQSNRNSDKTQPADDSIITIQRAVNHQMQEIINIIQNLQEYEENEYLQNMVNLSSKEFIVTEVTRKLSEVTESFKTMQREVIRNLDNLILNVQHAKGNILPQIKPLLENTIDLIDKAILKSDITLYTDMKTEKELLQASSQLADARRMLAKGDSVGARQVLEEVKAMLRNIEFQPKDIKVRHYITNELFASLPKSETEKWNYQVDRLITQQHMGPSAKNTFEMIRNLGLNYDSELAQALSSSSGSMSQEEVQRNMKAVLLNLFKGESEFTSNSLVPKDIEQVINNLTGQQLLSKTDTGNLQSMFFSLPLMLGKQVEKLNVYINSKKDGHKIDWENCSIYFLIETKKLGETGILLTSTDRKLSITLKNDQAIFKQKMEPLLDKYQENLKEIGYTITGIHFTNLNSKSSTQDHKPESKSIEPAVLTNKKGFDFKI